MSITSPAGSGGPNASDLGMFGEELRDDPLAAVRRSCAEVARRARGVRIVHAGIERLGEGFVAEDGAAPGATAFPRLGMDPESRVSFVLCLGAINFGSGWFPELVKRPGLSGYRTLEAQLLDAFERDGPPEVADLRQATGASMAALLGQTSAPPSVAELMELYARAWRDLAQTLDQRFGGSYRALVEDARGSAARLVSNLLEMPLFRDVAVYDGRPVAFLKRAQLSAADLAAALPDGLGRFHDLERLTAFADNLVPHVLRLDGALEFDPRLEARIERSELIAPGSAEEVEIRACGVEAVELLRRSLSERGVEAPAMQLDAWLWTRGGAGALQGAPATPLPLRLLLTPSATAALAAGRPPRYAPLPRG